MVDNNEILPKYFSCEFFQKCLGLKAQVTNFEAKSAVGKGENYTSFLYRVRLQFKNKETKSIIVKCCPEDGKMKQMLENSGVFEIESSALATLVPDGRKLLCKAGIDTKLGPDLLFYKNDPPCIGLEDLKVSGYVLADRTLGLDLDHSKLVLRKLAKLHGVGKMLFDRDISRLKPFTKCVYNESNEVFDNFCTTCVEATAKQVNSWGVEYEPIADKLIKIKNRVPHNLKPIYRKDCLFKVVNHGDFWVNNMMFKYEEGKVKDVVLVDFQCSFYGSPATDILYFLHGSCNEDVFWQNRHELIKFYHDNLVRVLKTLQYEGYILTLQDLQRELDICKFMAVYTVTCIKPILMNKSIEESDDVMEEMEKNGSNKNSVIRKYTNPKLIQVLKPRLKFLNLQGMLD